MNALQRGDELIRRGDRSGDVPIAICALERLVTIVGTFVDRERPGDGEGLAAAREVTGIWLCRRETSGRSIMALGKMRNTRTLLSMSTHMLR